MFSRRCERGESLARRLVWTLCCSRRNERNESDDGEGVELCVAHGGMSGMSPMMAQGLNSVGAHGGVSVVSQVLAQEADSRGARGGVSGVAQEADSRCSHGGLSGVLTAG